MSILLSRREVQKQLKCRPTWSPKQRDVGRTRENSKGDELSELYAVRRYSASVGEHYIIALIGVEEYCSALQVKEKAKRN